MSERRCLPLLSLVCLLAAACGLNLGTLAATEGTAQGNHGLVVPTPSPQSQEQKVQADLTSIFEHSTRPPALTVDEYPIIAAEVDGPGHLEYNDRLGEEILTRLDGSRQDAAALRLQRTNAALAPFGYRLSAHWDTEWNRMFYDLWRADETEPLLPRLSGLWPLSVNASGTDFVLAAENGPNARPSFLLVSADGVQEWDASASSGLPPRYVGDALARITYSDFPTLTYRVELDNRVVYTGTTVAIGANMPLRSFTAWDGHWVLEVSDHLIMDGEDVGQAMGYDATFGFTVLHGEPLYFLERDGAVHISYAGKTLSHVYEQVFHDQCCEASIHNVYAGEGVVWFHALRNGTWYLVEAGVSER